MLCFKLPPGPTPSGAHTLARLARLALLPPFPLALFGLLPLLSALRYLQAEAAGRPPSIFNRG